MTLDDLIPTLQALPRVEKLRLCQLLGFLTEEERRTQAVLQSAVASKWSAIAAAVSAIIALLALLLAFGFGKGCQAKAQPGAPRDASQASRA